MRSLSGNQEGEEPRVQKVAVAEDEPETRTVPGLPIAPIASGRSPFAAAPVGTR